jgi:hypothetical protein
VSAASLRLLIRCMLDVVALIHFLPLLGVLGAGHLEQLYGVAITDPNLQILMRHRAALFGLLGTFLVWSVFRPQLWGLAISSGLVSVLSFLLIAALVVDYNPKIARVVLADWIAAACLAIAAFAQFRLWRSARGAAQRDEP